MTNSIKGACYGLICALCWSFTGLVTKVVPLSVYTISGIEGTASLIVLIYINRKRIKITRFVFLIGLIQFLMHITFAYANKMCNIGNAIILQYTSMIFILIYQFIDKKIKPYSYQIIVITIAFLGVLIFFYGSISFNDLVGSILAIVSGAFLGLQFYLNTKKEANPICSNIVQFGFAVVSMMAYLTITKDTEITVNQIGFLLFAGLVCGLFASVCFAKCIKLISAFSANVICMSEIIFAPIWGIIFLHETINTTSLIGGVLIIFALIYNKYKEYKLGVY